MPDATVLPAREALAHTARWLAAHPPEPGGTEEVVLTDPLLTRGVGPLQCEHVGSVRHDGDNIGRDRLAVAGIDDGLQTLGGHSLVHKERQVSDGTGEPRERLEVLTE